jgi:hypothetical protein
MIDPPVRFVTFRRLDHLSDASTQICWPAFLIALPPVFSPMTRHCNGGAALDKDAARTRLPISILPFAATSCVNQQRVR